MAGTTDKLDRLPHTPALEAWVFPGEGAWKGFGKRACVISVITFSLFSYGLLWQQNELEVRNTAMEAWEPRRNPRLWAWFCGPTAVGREGSRGGLTVLTALSFGLC